MMAGMGPPPKTAAERRRRNRVAGARMLAPVGTSDVPPLLLEDVHPMTVAWWADIWASPMASEFDRSDIHGLFMLACLVDKFWRRPSKDLAAEIRLQRQAFGLSPLDRRRLQWEIDRGGEASERTAKRQASARPKAVKDPRVADGGVQGPPSRRRSSA